MQSKKAIFVLCGVVLMLMGLDTYAQEVKSCKPVINRMANGIWKLRFGGPERFTPEAFRAEQPKYEAVNNLNDQNTPPINFDQIGCTVMSRGIVLELPLTDSEEIYGLGLSKYYFGQRGLRKELKTCAHDDRGLGAGHVPVPFYVSSSGYGVYIDTARYATFYVGTHGRIAFQQASRQHNLATVDEADLYRTERMQSNTCLYVDIPVTQGIDIYIFSGTTIRDVLSRYNLFSGGGCLPPLWGLGVKYEGKGDHDANDTLALARYLRQDGIPCDVYTFPVAWQSHAYSSSLAWNSKMFPEPSSLLKELVSLGFRPSLWEQAYIDPSSPLFPILNNKCGDFAVWRGLVPDFGKQNVRQLFGEYHKSQFIDQNVFAFKLDECDGDGSTEAFQHWQFPEHSIFPSGLDGEQMKMLLGSLYQRSMYEAFKKANRRTFGNVRASYALAAPYPFVLYSDEYDFKEYITYNTTAAFAGVLWDPELRHAESFADYNRRLGVMAFSAMMHLDGWQFEKPMWLQPNIDKNNAGQLLADPSAYTSLVKRFGQLRMSLIPYLYSAYARYAYEGIPPVRAMICDYTDDPRFRDISDQWMLGDSLLIAPFVTENSFERAETIQLGSPESVGGLEIISSTGTIKAKGKFIANTIAGISVPIQLDPGDYTVSMHIRSPFNRLAIRLWENINGKIQDVSQMYIDGVPCPLHGNVFQRKFILSKGGQYTLVISKDYGSAHDSSFIEVNDLQIIRFIKGEPAKRTKRIVTLPRGNWYDLWTRQRYDGGQAIVVQSQIGQIPVFVKENTLLPLAKPLQCVRDDTVFELICVPYGPEPEPFTLYEDDGVTYDCISKGLYNKVIIDKSGKFQRQGSFTGVRYKLSDISESIDTLNLTAPISEQEVNKKNWYNVVEGDTSSLDANFVNVAIQGSWRASSKYDEAEGAGNLLDKTAICQPFAFSTAFEIDPWVEIDLKNTCIIKRLEIWNRQDGRPEIIERAVPMMVYISDNGKDWKPVWDTAEPKNAWAITFNKAINARYIKIQTDKKTYLHLAKVKVFGRPLQ